MIHIVIGGSLAGKTTFVRKRFLDNKSVLGRLDGVPVTVGPNNTLVVGNYLAKTRTCGVDQLGRDYRLIHKKLETLALNYDAQYGHFVFEGNACADPLFMEMMKGWNVKLYLVTATAKQIQERVKKHQINYGKSIIALSYRRAFKVFHFYKGVFAHEIIQ